MKMDTAKLVVFGHFISVLIFSFGLECVTSSKDLALNKTATQSSTLFDGQNAFGAGRAVDGVLGRDVMGGHCSHTGLRQGQAWWKVDLGEVYMIQTINITYRHDFTSRLSGYYLYVTNDTNMAKSNGGIDEHLGRLCYHDHGPGYPSYNQSRTCLVTGRYVIFYNKRPADYVPPDHNSHHSTTDTLIELCEVQVFGCPLHHFAANCNKTCHCEIGGCHPDTGVCDIPGCQDGWTEETCSVCDTNHFGPDCTKQCHCKTEGCNRIDGTCNVTGCQAGWTRRSCDQKCSSAHFGPHCSEVCHCQQEGCDHVIGRCHHVGCQPGWSGHACDHQCDGNTFGRDCRETCHCASSGCDRVSGMCTISGCTEGWTGVTCSQVCVAGRFGKHCLQECHCQIEGCDNVDGTCNVTGCVDGWRGKSCDHTCDFTHYGPNCLYECHCNLSGCSNTNGLCQTPGCEEGWTGPSCSDAKEQKSSKSDCPQIAEVSTCATGYALLGTFLAISISFNIGLTIQRVRLRLTNSRTKPPSKELQTYHIPNHENSYDGLDSTKIDKTRNIYDTIVQ